MSYSPRFKFSLARLFAFIAFASVAIFIAKGYLLRKSADKDIAFARENIRRIFSALEEYQRVEGRLPYSERGDGAALYSLRHSVGADTFNVWPRDKIGPRPCWDDAHSQLLNDDIYYLNEPDSRLNDARIVLVVETHDLLQLFVTGNGIVRRQRPPIPPLELLGSWVTVEGFLVVDEVDYDSWCETHPSDSLRKLTNSESSSKPFRVVLTDGSQIHYFYDDGLLSGCKIVTKHGEHIHEAVETDQYGRITGISRYKR